MAIRPGFDRLLKLRDGLKDRAVREFDQGMRAMHQNAARRLAAVLSVPPDDVFAPDGDDGDRIGQTDLERRLEGLTEGAQLRASVLLTTLTEIEDFLEAAGLDVVRSGLLRSVADLGGYAEETFRVMGVEGARGALDTVGAEARFGGFFETAINEGLLGAQGRAEAIKIKEALSASLGILPAGALLRNLADELDATLPQRLTEARTRMAQADRVASQIVKEILEEDGEQFLTAYTGPPATDKIIRPFCKQLVGKVFDDDQMGRLDNAQTSVAVSISGGGYNCRHDLQHVRNDRRTLEDLGFVRGTDEDISAANDAAQGARKKRGKR